MTTRSSSQPKPCRAAPTQAGSTYTASRIFCSAGAHLSCCTALLRRCAPLAVCVSLLGSPSMALAVLGPAPGSVTAETLTLPTTPGSLRRWRRAGAGGFRRSGATPSCHRGSLPDRAGVAPSLTLRYDGNLGDGPLGPGWTLDVPQIRRSVGAAFRRTPLRIRSSWLASPAPTGASYRLRTARIVSLGREIASACSRETAAFAC